MLFAVKNRLGATLFLLAVFVGAALGARQALGLRWNIVPSPHLALDAGLAFLLIVTSDALLQLSLTLLLGRRYLARFQALAEYFRPQGLLEIAASGLLAGGEEMVFRGVLLQVLLGMPALGTVSAVTVSALSFGALHTLRDPKLAPFALWGVWQGILLGAAYVVTGSLLVTMLVHAAHDSTGFTLFALQRRYGLFRPGECR